MPKMGERTRAPCRMEAHRRGEQGGRLGKWANEPVIAKEERAETRGGTVPGQDGLTETPAQLSEPQILTAC